MTADAPPERLAAFRIAVGVFAVVYLVLRVPVLLDLRDRSAGGFAGVGVLWWRDAPFGDGVFTVLLVVAVVGGIGFTMGAWFRVTGPVFAIAMLILTTYRSSWGQLLHFENLMVLHLLIVGFAASADAWSLDAHRRMAAVSLRHDYAGPLRLACVVVVVAYVIAGIAKLRYGGLDWIVGDTLRNHIAYSAARLDLLGGAPSPLARPVVDHDWMLRPMAAASVAIELGAPVALLGGWWRIGWVAAAWLMHVAIAALMLIVFPYPLFLVAFLAFFELERAWPALARWRDVGYRRRHA